MFWPSRAGPRAGPSTLRSASARRRRRGSPRCAARASPLHLSGLVGSSPFPRSLSSASVSAAVFATLRKRAAPPPGSHPARGPRPSASLFGTRGPRSDPPDPFSSTHASIYVRAGRSGPPLRPPTLGSVHLMGGRSPPLRHFPLAGGERGGTWSALGKRRAGPVLTGGEAGLGPVLSLSRMRSRCGTPIPIVLRPSWGKQVSPDKASPPTHCVNLVSRNRGSPDRFESG